MRTRQLKLGLKETKSKETEIKEKKLRRESTLWLITTVLSFISFVRSGYLLTAYPYYYIDSSFWAGVLMLSGVILIISVAMWGREKEKDPPRLKLK